MTPTQIRAIRDSLGLTQAQFAPWLGYSHKNRISDLECGKMDPSGAVILLLRAYAGGYRPEGWPNAQGA